MLVRAVRPQTVGVVPIRLTPELIKLFALILINQIFYAFATLPRKNTGREKEYAVSLLKLK